MIIFPNMILIAIIGIIIVYFTVISVVGFMNTKKHQDNINGIIIEHPIAEEGYIILNGRKIKREDCKYL